MLDTWTVAVCTLFRTCKDALVASCIIVGHDSHVELWHLAWAVHHLAVIYLLRLCPSMSDAIGNGQGF